MPMDGGAGAFPLAGRRRVTLLSKDEWREALQQQMQEKEKQKRAQRDAKYSALPPIQHAHTGGSENNQTEDHAGSALCSAIHHKPEGQETPSSDVVSYPRAGGRRFVRAMSNEEWKASLEEQIRKKESHQLPRSHTAPLDTSAGESNGPERLVTTAESSCNAVAVTIIPQPAGDKCPVVGGRRRGVQTQQSREEYLKGLEEQIELKKKQHEAQQSSTKLRGGNGRRRIIEDDDSDGFWPPQQVPSQATSLEPVQKTVHPVQHLLPDDNSASPTEVLKTAATTGAVGVVESKATPTPQTPSAVVAMDPAALSKLFELCEGMKQQNEELKQQLREQQTVLATLSEKAAVDDTPTVKTKLLSTLSKTKPNRNDRIPPQPKPPTGPTKATDPKRAPQKTPSKSRILPSVSEKIENALTPTRKVTMESVEWPERAATEEKKTGTPTKVLPPPTKSRLPPPRVVPRLRKAPATPTKIVADSGVVTALTAVNTDAVSSERSPPRNATVPIDKETPSAVDDSSEAQTYAPTLLSLKTSSDRLPRLVSSPPIHHMKKTSRSPAHSVSLPSIDARGSKSHTALKCELALRSGICLDDNASTELTSTTRMRDSLSPCRHVDRDDLEVFSSSTPILYGPSTMIPCDRSFFI